MTEAELAQRYRHFLDRLAALRLTDYGPAILPSKWRDLCRIIGQAERFTFDVDHAKSLSEAVAWDDVFPPDGGESTLRAAERYAGLTRYLAGQRSDAPGHARLKGEAAEMRAIHNREHPEAPLPK